MASGARLLLTHSGLYAIGSIARSLAGFVMLPVYTRYLSPEDYGVASLMMLTISIFELLFGARLGHALPKYYFERDDQRYRNTLVSTALVFTGATSVLTTLACYLLQTEISDILFGTPRYSLVVGIFSILLLGQALETHGLDLMRLRQMPGLFVGVSILKLALQIALNVWLIVYEGRGIVGLAVASALASSLIALMMLLYVIMTSGVRFSTHWAVRMFKFSWPMWLGGLAGLYIGSSGRYYMRIFSSIDDVGLYSLAERFAAILGMLIWQPFWQYWVPESYRYYNRGNAEPVFRGVFLLITTGLMLCGLGISIFSGPVIQIMSSKEFHGAAAAVPFLILAAFFHCCTGFTNFSFMVKEKTGRLSINHYITAGVVTVLYVLLIPILGFVGAAMALAGAHVIQFLIVYYSARKHYDMGISLVPVALQLGAYTFACGLNALIPADLSLTWDIAQRMGVYVLGAALLIGIASLDADLRSRFGELVSSLQRRWSLKPRETDPSRGL